MSLPACDWGSLGRTCARFLAGWSDCALGQWSRSTCSASSLLTPSLSTLCISISVPIYALGALMVTMIAADAVLDHQAVWEALESPAPAQDAAPNKPGAMDRAVGCEVCGLLNQCHTGAPMHCVRCGFHLHARKPDSIGRAWALMIAGVILYAAGQFLPCSDGGPARLRHTEHHHGRCRRAAVERHVPARGAGILRQYPCACAQADRTRQHAGRHRAWLGAAATRPHKDYRVVAAVEDAGR